MAKINTFTFKGVIGHEPRALKKVSVIDNNVSCPDCNKVNTFLDLAPDCSGFCCYVCKGRWRFPRNWLIGNTKFYSTPFYSSVFDFDSDTITAKLIY